MINFFLNLASRAVDNENAVRPRVTGRFEPSEPAAELAEINEEIVIGTGATLIARDSRQQRWDSRMSGLEAAEEPGVQAAPPRFSPPSESAKPINAGAVEVPQSIPPVRARPEINPAGGKESQTALLRSMSPDVHDTDVEELPPQGETTAAKRDSPAHKQAVVSPPAQIAITRPAAAGSATAPNVTAAASHRPVIGKPARETIVARKPREMPRPADAVPPPETVVHVTIGRVELRAPATAAPRKREQAPSQVGTLAEYLQKHAARTRP